MYRKTTWLTHQTEGTRYLCWISYNKLEPRQHWNHRILIFFLPPSKRRLYRFLTTKIKINIMFIFILDFTDKFSKQNSLMQDNTCRTLLLVAIRRSYVCHLTFAETLFKKLNSFSNFMFCFDFCLLLNFLFFSFRESLYPLGCPHESLPQGEIRQLT